MALMTSPNEPRRPMLRVVDDQADEPDVEIVPVDDDQDDDLPPVDPPDEPATLYGTITATADADKRPVVPAWLRNAQQRRDTLRMALQELQHHTLYHLTRSPKYAVKVLLWAPVGVVRVIGRLLRWASAEDGNWQLRQAAANRNDPQAWLTLDRHRQASARWRWWVLGGGTLAAGVGGGVLASDLTPGPVRLAVLACGTLVLARLGRPADKPITDRVSVGPRFVKLTAEMVRGALCSLGLSGLKDPAQLTFPTEIHRDGPGWLARVNLPQGVEAVEVLERRGRLSSALRLPVDQVWPSAGPEHAGQLDLWVGMLPASTMGQPAWSLASPSARTSVFDAHEFGTDQRQRPIVTPLFARNFLVGGVPGSGKSYAARALALIGALDPLCELKIAEHKGTADFGDLAPLCSTYVCGVTDAEFEASLGILEWGLAEAKRRGDRIRKARERGEAPEGKVTPELAAKPGSGLHPVLIIIDEAHELFGDAEVGKNAAIAAERLIKRGRALGLIVVLATQIPDRNSLPPIITRCVNVRWCLAVLDQVANDMILGTGAYKRGLTATVYRPEIDAGWGIMTGIRQAGPVRSHFPTPEVAAAIVARATQLRGGVVGNPIEQAARRDVHADARSVFRAGQARISWPELATRLAEQWPEHYADAGPDAVRALLGVPSVNVKDARHFESGTGKGCRVEDIDKAIEAKAITAGAGSGP